MAEGALRQGVWGSTVPARLEFWLSLSSALVSQMGDSENLPPSWS